MQLRIVKQQDVEEILHIYTPYIEKTWISFEEEVPSITEFKKRVERIFETMPYIVAIEDGKIVGYAYANRYRERVAYDWSVELSVYIDENAKRKGIGTKLYDALLALLRELGYCRVYACIAYPNPESVHFHSTYGFKEIGIFHKCGYKFNTWIDILWMELDIQQDATVIKPKSIQEISKQIIEKCLR